MLQKDLRVDPDSYGKFYWERYENTTMGRYLSNRELAFIAQLFSALKHTSRILDIGCGSGRLIRLLQEGHGSGNSMMGMDIDRVAITAFRRQAREIPMVLGDALNLPYAQRCFDCVIAIQCFQYFDNHHRFLEECHRVLS